MSQRPCDFYNSPRGCRNGANCRFAHVRTEDRSASPSGRIMGQRGGRTGSPGGRSTADSGSQDNTAPPGVCREFWSSARCRHGFRCRYAHRQAPGVNAQATSPNNGTSAVEAIAPFLNEAGLARLAGPGTDAYATANVASGRGLGPTEAQNHLRTYLRDNFRFHSSINVYGFAKILESASATNNTWLLLSALATGNGLLRLIDVIQWPRVSIRAGHSREELSFQRGYIPVLRYMSSEFVVRSTLSHLVNALYSGLIGENFDHFSNVVQQCMDDAMSRKSFKDITQPTSSQLSGNQIIACLCGVLFEFLTRFKNAVPTYKGLRPLVLKLRDWADAWMQGVSAAPPSFDDAASQWTPVMRETILDHLRTKVNPLIAIVDREQAKMDRRTRQQGASFASSAGVDFDEAIVAALLNAYEGPGEERAGGPRHDNDFVDTDRIRTVPTHDELACRIPPFLPANIYGAPHPFPAESMQRLLDIQFRLLREELTAPLRSSAQLVMDDLHAPPGTKTRLAEIVGKKGGKYRSFADKLDSIMFNIYTEVKFSSLEPDRRGVSVCLSLDAPPGLARSPQAKARAHFWEGAGGKRLMQGGLIGLIWKARHDVTVHLGVVASSTRDLAESAKQSNTRVAIRVVFFDSDVELRILQVLKNPEAERGGTMLLVEAPVMFESIRPFLEALRTEPETVPFAKYLSHHPRGYLEKVQIDPPQYARLPGFTYKLDCLFDSQAGVRDLVMDVTNIQSMEAAREHLKKGSRLDASQADAVVDALTREVALIQGPPGTGKSYTGVELLRALLANQVRPILMIAFTNHALDHLLRSVLETNVTKRVVRLGSRSNDEKISKLNIEDLEALAGQSRLDREFARLHRALKQVQDELKHLMEGFLQVALDSNDIVDFLQIQYPAHYEALVSPPSWVSLLHGLQANANDGYQTVYRRGQSATPVDDSLYAFWRDARDLRFLESAGESQGQRASDSSKAPPRDRHHIGGSKHTNTFSVLADVGPSEAVDESLSAEDETERLLEEQWMDVVYDSDSDTSDTRNLEKQVNEREIPGNTVASTPPRTLQASDLRDLPEFFAHFGLLNVPSPPTGNVGLDQLLDEDSMWSLSKKERERLHRFWEDRIRMDRYANQVADFDRLRKRHREALDQYNEGKEESRRTLLQNVDIIGCTTTGAAKLTTLLKGIAPRVLIVEEAGQVLEAHVLGSLVPSIQHLIMIGDPLQLRPTLNNFVEGLSMDNRQGAQLYRFDMSLMERLSSAGLPMSRIDVQRRMRPTISNLIRHTLYPTLVDHELVQGYTHVRGFAKDVFFLSHNHVENGGEDSGSKYNIFEVNMIKDLVLYLLRQGCYSNEGDIVVLCAYLGQLARMRDALSDEIAVVIDERDQQLLAEQEEDGEGTEDRSTAVEHLKISKRVRLRTIDNFQGEEAKIVILSLVRNSGGAEDDEQPITRTNIGFLKSENRTNVALSRAKEGLFILGNAQNLSARSKMWRSVLSELDDNGAVGAGFPIACQRHPDRVEYVSKPGQLPRVAPDGGCLRSCDARLACGHVCPYKCHSDDPRHVTVICSQPCRRLCPRGHPCTKQCATPCGACLYPIRDVKLPCGHVQASVPCNVPVKKQLPTCEHQAEMPCSQDPATHLCKSACGGTMACCGRPCGATCSQCQGLNTIGRALGDEEDAPPTVVPRIKHTEHPCTRTLPCEHRCQQACSENHECTTECKEPCRQVCVHARCKNYCSTPCSPCQEACTWTCAHYACPVPCGSVCARLPCDTRCDKMLSCGHQCPSVCGEDCNIQVCPTCASEDEKSRIVDFIMHETLGNVNPDLNTLDQMLVTLPTCRHVFTVETLDGICDIKAYYTHDEQSGRWLGLKAPAPGFLKPPVCPTCRAAITAPRYGRIFKRADLDILEKNVANRMARSLATVSGILDQVSKIEMQNRLKEAATGIQVASVAEPRSQRQRRQKQIQGLIAEQRETPVPPSSLNPQAAEWHNISAVEAGVWRKVVRPLIQAYEQAVTISKTRSAHIHAWESAFSCLAQRELDAALMDPAHAPRNPNEHSMRMARLLVGQPKPQADKRFCVEAFWFTINIRFTLAELAQTWMDAVKEQPNYARQRWQQWATYKQFLLQTCLSDARIALDIATRSEARRQMTTTSLLIMRAELDRFQFNVKMSRESGKFAEQREKLAESAKTKHAVALAHKESVIRAHMQKMGGAEADWLRQNFIDVADTICEQWEALETNILADTFYQDVTVEEKMSVLAGFKHEFYGYRGHFYTCPQGHIYAIADCGGAVMTASCPECGAQIGGTGHQLLSSNRRAMDMEELATQQGYARNPHPWGNI
ncbi:P-loop containing nucleoside triphosphate hydrolase protein [Gloeophyllum trabeum ATCC 11539]|uniref:p-loop containing nucleoside triphosphate hydrolase protein n=1 Tax=Gloeophyllum trabeum (strain ATCC 11539 / FP-39264 / Madison 617) TaxID=670483 RepID=S7RVD0_GLOTA|nr:P-loop containing nucleoside triphosphate hydrolase protein [Gloeophyllum trabeum ATCC 11539]EPQ57199.1 P-loop containing nucleoside triphosphate hydrolase protein [Gloeophyllum trabeum ATCC 11539]